MVAGAAGAHSSRYPLEIFWLMIGWEAVYWDISESSPRCALVKSAQFNRLPLGAIPDLADANVPAAIC
jgi:hypothetical protein